MEGEEALHGDGYEALRKISSFFSHELYILSLISVVASSFFFSHSIHRSHFPRNFVHQTKHFVACAARAVRVTVSRSLPPLRARPDVQVSTLPPLPFILSSTFRRKSLE